VRRRRAIGDSGRRLRRARALHGTTVGRTASIGHMYRALRFELGTSAFRLLPAMDDGWSGARPRVEVSRRQRVEILCAALSLILVERPHDVGQGETDIERMGSKLSATVTALNHRVDPNRQRSRRGVPSWEASCRPPRLRGRCELPPCPRLAPTPTQIPGQPLVARAACGRSPNATLASA